MQSYYVILLYENLMNFRIVIQVLRKWFVVKLKHLLSTFETTNYITKAKKLTLLKLPIIKQKPDNQLKENYLC